MRQLFNYQDLIAYLVMRELTVRYRRSVLGFAWTMLQPMLTMTVLFAVFSSIFRFQIRNYPVYALSGILFWNFFSQSIVGSMTSLAANAGLIQKVPVPKAVFPIASVIGGVINLLLALIPLLGLVLVTRHPVTPTLLFLPISILLAAVFTLGAGLLLAPLSIFFSDIVEMVRVVLLLLFYMTPCFYPRNIVPERFDWVVRYSPIRSILEVFRDPIYLHKIPPLTHLMVATGVAAVALLVGIAVFRHSSDRINYFL